MIVESPSLSIKIWWKLVRQDKTLFRSMEDEQITRLRLRGRVLDIGGGANFDYTNLIHNTCNLDSINISPQVNPTIVADLNFTLPIADETYDNVICFNTLEHIQEDQNLLQEMLRVLKPGGRFVVTVPFLFPRHGSYGDYHRHTAEYWEKELCKRRIDTSDFIIKPLSYSPLSSALAALPWFRGGMRGKFFKAIVLLTAYLRRKQSTKALTEDVDYALGFYIDGIKSL